MARSPRDVNDAGPGDRFAGRQRTVPKSHTAWTPKRVARLAFLIGQGWDARQIAADSIVATTQNNIYRATERFGLRLRDIPHPSGLDPDAAALIDGAAAKRGVTREGLIDRIVTILACDPDLLANILDDDL